MELQLLRRYDENGDIGRIQRQQILMRALMEQSSTQLRSRDCPKFSRKSHRHQLDG